MSHLLQNKKTKVLLWTLLGVAVVAVGVFVYAWATGSLSSSASGLWPPGGGGTGNVGWFASISGQVTDKSTGKPVSGASLVFKCTNAITGFSCKSPTGSSDVNGRYTLNDNVKVKTVTTAPVGSNTYTYKYTVTVTAGSLSGTFPGLSWDVSSQNQPITQNFQLSTTGTPTPTPIGGQGLHGLATNGTTSTASIFCKGAGLTECPWTITFDSSPDLGSVPVSIWNSTSNTNWGKALAAGTYKISGASIKNSKTGASLNWNPGMVIEKVITAGDWKSLNMTFK